mmetsp:Transcript_111293/g.355043  ORF Transcript_111293/g.355043 Transcript_111293/m.355043 type:complete len:366 (+) Transcript_111293:141-1238(+)
MPWPLRRGRGLAPAGGRARGAVAERPAPAGLGTRGSRPRPPRGRRGAGWQWGRRPARRPPAVSLAPRRRQARTAAQGAHVALGRLAPSRRRRVRRRADLFPACDFARPLPTCLAWRRPRRRRPACGAWGAGPGGVAHGVLRGARPALAALRRRGCGRRRRRRGATPQTRGLGRVHGAARARGCGPQTGPPHARGGAHRGRRPRPRLRALPPRPVGDEAGLPGPLVPGPRLGGPAGGRAAGHAARGGAPRYGRRLPRVRDESSALGSDAGKARRVRRDLCRRGRAPAAGPPGGDRRVPRCRDARRHVQRPRQRGLRSSGRRPGRRWPRRRRRRPARAARHGLCTRGRAGQGGHRWVWVGGLRVPRA